MTASDDRGAMGSPDEISKNEKGRSLRDRPFELCRLNSPRSARIILDHEMRLHRRGKRNVRQLRRAHEATLHAVRVRRKVFGNLTLARRDRFEDQRHLAGLAGNLDGIAIFDLIGRDGDALTVDADMAVADELA